MLETFLILLAGGVMLAACVCDPRAVTLQWLRLCGILSITFAGVALYWYASRDAVAIDPGMRRLSFGLQFGLLAAIAGQLAFVQVAQRDVQRAFAGLAYALAVAAGAAIVLGLSPVAWSWVWVAIAVAGAGAMCGLALMDMLLGHAYLTASKMTIAPFLRLNRALAATLALRTGTSVVLALLVNVARPVPKLWAVYGLLIGTRWLVGLLVPAIFVYMAHDCIRRRSTQSATGILYVAGVLIFIGEIIALQLLRDTGLPF
jgi:hypothetical protein